MKRFALLVALLAASGAAWAQGKRPQVIPPDDTIEVAIGEPRILRFTEPFKDVRTAIKDIAEVTPQSDHMLTVTGRTPGQTTLFVQAADGRTLYIATVSVAASTGSLVKIYRSDVKDFIGVYCNGEGCGRADLDKTLANGGRDPSEPVDVTISRPTRDGGVITKHYRPN